MKKFFKSLAICGLIACMGVSSVVVNGNTTANAATNVLDSFVDATAAYNEVYSFKTKDANGNMLTYSVKNSAGASVFVYNYSFAVTETTAYTVTVSNGKNSKTYKLTPQDVSAPLIQVERDIQRINVLKGEKASYPEVYVTDNADGEVEVTYAVTYNGEAYTSENDGFTPTKLGYYELTISAKDDANNVSTKKVVYESVETVEETYKVFAFDEDALRYFDYVGTSPVMEYNTDEKYVYGEEKGSTRMTFVASGTPLFCVKNQLIDTSEFDYIHFYVYNAYHISVNLAVGIGRGFNLQPGTWTEIIIDVWEESHTPNMSHSDITGLCTMVFTSGDYSDERYGFKGDLYFSAAYGVKA